MMNWWLDRGVGGFRMDVIDLIGKDIDARLYMDGPDQHRFLREMHDACLAGRDIMTVGEAWSVTPKTALNYCATDRAELDMMFNFNHVEAAFHPEKGRFGPNNFDLCTHKSILFDWQAALADDGWNSLYLSNHDLPRAVSFYGDDGAYRLRSAKMLAMATYLMRGTPFIYQGEEIGMTNVTFTLGQFRDIEIFGLMADQTANGVSAADFIAGANAHGRDNARTPMHWDDSIHAGFTTGTPWIDVNPNHAQINARNDCSDANGVFAFYRALIALRRDNTTIQNGAFVPLEPDHPHIMAFARKSAKETIFILCNYAAETVDMPRPQGLKDTAQVVLINTAEQVALGDTIRLEPYQAVAWSVQN